VIISNRPKSYKEVIELKTKRLMVLIGSVCLVLMLVVPLVASCASPAPTPVEKRVMKFIYHEPADTWMSLNQWGWWSAKVNELAEERGLPFEFKDYPGEIICKAPDMSEAVEAGTVEAGLIVGPYEAGRRPLETIVELPFTFRDYPSQNKLWHDALDAGLDEYFESFNLKVVCRMWTSPYGVWANTPIPSIDTLKGMKVRAPGGQMTAAVEKMGMVPVSMTVMETYTALQRGTLDGVSLMEPSIISLKLDEVCTYGLRINYAASAGCLAVNLDVWNTLPKEFQDVCLEAGRLQEARNDDLHWNEMVNIAENTAPARGIEIRNITPDEREILVKLTRPQWDEWKEAYGDEFNGLGNKLYDIAMAKVAAEEGLPPTRWMLGM